MLHHHDQARWLVLITMLIAQLDAIKHLQAEVEVAEAQVSNFSAKAASQDCQMAGCQTEVAKLEADLEHIHKTAQQASLAPHAAVLPVLPVHR